MIHQLLVVRDVQIDIDFINDKGKLEDFEKQVQASDMIEIGSFAIPINAENVFKTTEGQKTTIAFRYKHENFQLIGTTSTRFNYPFVSAADPVKKTFRHN
eukprot:TRINITY_DN11866_c0_g1_i1.p1 TRINITY_DN11866_c0_g1~~TRINITY_DN11866_c0_g1_i1.p1  ORF type:complete len:100 (+),score=16.68 TRINITY_DN11866_c0_g1_i1:129-428(+)